MPHQCTKCGEIFPDAAEELLKGCGCGSRFFYYIKQEKFDELNELKDKEIQDTIIELDKADKTQIEKDIREITGLDEEPEKPVILDLESIKVIKPGKFEIDIVNLFSKNRPLIYKLEEGKYIIDLNASLKVDKKEIDKMIKNPATILNKNLKQKQDIKFTEHKEDKENIDIFEQEDDEQEEDKKEDEIEDKEE